MTGGRFVASLMTVSVGAIALAGCSHSSPRVDDARCVEFRKHASVYTDKITKLRHARRLIEDGLAGKAPTAQQSSALKAVTDAWLAAKDDLAKFYASDTSGCVSK